MIKIKRATFDEAVHIATNLREIDIKELGSSYEEMPCNVVIKSFDYADWCDVAFINEMPCVLFGVSKSEKTGCGLPWLVATEEIKTIPKRKVLEHSIKAVDEMHKEYDFLYNFVHPENFISINWLKWLGFTVTDIKSDNGLLYFFKRKDSKCV